jgi:hypothetical protein
MIMMPILIYRERKAETAVSVKTAEKDQPLLDNVGEHESVGQWIELDLGQGEGEEATIEVQSHRDVEDIGQYGALNGLDPDQETVYTVASIKKGPSLCCGTVDVIEEFTAASLRAEGQFDAIDAAVKAYLGEHTELNATQVATAANAM